MKQKLKRLLLLGMLLTSCVTASPATKCTLPKYPEPVEIVGHACGDFVCLTIETSVAIGTYVRDAERYRDAAEVCRGK